MKLFVILKMQKLSPCIKNFIQVSSLILFFLIIGLFLGVKSVYAAPYTSRPVNSGQRLLVNSSGEVGASSIHDTLGNPTFSGYVNNYGFMMDEQLSNEVFANVDKLRSGNAADLISKLKNAVKSGKTMTDKHKVAVTKGTDVSIWVGIPVAMCENSDRNVVFITVRAFYDQNGKKITDEATIMGIPCKNYRNYITQGGTKKVLYSLKMYMPDTSGNNGNNGGNQSPPDKPINVLVMSMDPNVTDDDIKNKYTPMVKNAILGIPVVASNQKYKDAFGVYECLKANCKYQEGGTSDDMTVQVPVGADLIVGITLDGVSTSVENNSCPEKSGKLVFRTQPETSTILHEFGHAFACLRHPTSRGPTDEEIGIGACIQGSQPNTCRWGNGSLSYNTSNCLNSLMAGAGTKFCQAEEDLIEKMINVYLGNSASTGNLQNGQTNSQSSTTSGRPGGSEVGNTGGDTGNSNNGSTDGNSGSGETGQSGSGGNEGVKNSRFPVMVRDGRYSGLQPQDYSYAWLTDGSLGYQAGNEPPQSVIDTRLPIVISRIKNKIGNKMLMVSDVDTLGKILPKYKDDLKNAGIEYIGYDMEISPPGTEQEEKDSRNDTDPNKNALIRAAKLASTNGFKLVWGSIFVSTIDITNGVMRTAIENGLWGIAFQMQNQWDNPDGGERLLNVAVTKYRDIATSIGRNIHITTQLMTDGKNCLSQGGTISMNTCSSLVQRQIKAGNMDSFSIWAEGGDVSEEFLKAVLGEYYTQTPSGVVSGGSQGSGTDSGTTSNNGQTNGTDSGSDGSGEYTQNANGLKISKTFCDGVKSRSDAVPMRYLQNVHPKNKLTVLFIGKGYAASEVKEMCVDAVIAANVIGMDPQYGKFADKYEPYFMEASLSSNFYWDNMGEIAGEFQQVRYGVKADIMIIFAKDGVIYKPGGSVQGEYDGNGKESGYFINAIQGVDAIPDIWTNRPAENDAYKIILRHELGHFFGLGHISQLVYSDDAWKTIEDAITKMIKGEMHYNWEK